MRGHLTEKTDVYAFGIVVLELVSGRGNADESLEGEKRYLLEWAWNLHEKSHEVELIDRELTEFNVEEVKRMIGIALLCTQASHAVRPPMSRVVAMLSGDVEVSEVTSKPIYLPDWRFDDTTRISAVAFVAEESSVGFVDDQSPWALLDEEPRWRCSKKNLCGSPRRRKSAALLYKQTPRLAPSLIESSSVSLISCSLGVLVSVCVSWSGSVMEFMYCSSNKVDGLIKESIGSILVFSGVVAL
ncbi:hypothetical protein F2Q70_00013936 [Brassica cretica]|uniref:Serine-threonine/tyrosine-protein kinase catalytic domain-containing protein n=1 Tax=Brassica cretica TaxID=69181 RepID=A0A8S9LU46_BRACR|nr:hypothetical protein F2Q70_00013936 [Brassica cretica]